MPGVGKLLKQAQKMQQQMEAVQEGLKKQVMTLSAGGGAVTFQVNGQGEFLSLKLDPEFLKEEKSFVEETLLGAIKEASEKARKP